MKLRTVNCAGAESLVAFPSSTRASTGLLSPVSDALRITVRNEPGARVTGRLLNGCFSLPVKASNVPKPEGTSA